MTASMIAQPTRAERMQSFHEWMQGFDAYADLLPYDEAQSVNWRKGWRDAQAGEAQADTSAYLTGHVHVLSDAECAEMTAEYADWQADIEWMRGGM